MMGVSRNGRRLEAEAAVRFMAVVVGDVEGLSDDDDGDLGFYTAILMVKTEGGGLLSSL